MTRVVLEWDENKRLTNLDKHELDFDDCEMVFAGPHTEYPGQTVSGEKRRMIVGLIDDVYVTIVCTTRGDVTRIISLRKARRGERSKHRAIHGS